MDERRAPGTDALGRVEYVVERGLGGERETWLVMRASPDAVPRFADAGLTVVPGSRVVVEAASLRPIGVLDGARSPPSRPAGFNPYFDPPLAN